MSLSCLAEGVVAVSKVGSGINDAAPSVRGAVVVHGGRDGAVKLFLDESAEKT
jgi:hypothetical protein